MNEMLPSATPMKGIVTVELFDARTKKLLHREIKENFVALPAKERFAWVQMADAVGGMPANTPNYFAPPNAFTTLFLSGDASPESPLTERYVKLPIVGWANRTTQYAGTDPLRGTINAAESSWDRTKAHYVFDFPTHAANGTIASVGFAGFYSEVSFQSANFYKISSEPLPGSYANNSGMTLANGALYILDSSKVIHRIDPTTGKETGTIAVSGISATIYALTYGEGYFWTGDYSSGKIYKINHDGTLNSTITISIPYVSAITYDNGYLWVFSQSSTSDPNTGMPYYKSLYRVSTSGTIVSVLTLPNAVYSDLGGFDLSVDSSFLYFGTNLDTSTCTTCNDSYQSYYVVDKRTGGLVASFRTKLPGIGIETAGDGSLYTIKYFAVDSSQYAGRYLTKVYLGALGTRVLLGSPITKNNAQTLKVTYDILYNLNPS